MISINEQPYPLPDGWQWVTMKDIATLFTGNSINKKIKVEKYFGRTDGLIYIATKDIGFDNQIDYATNIRIPASDNFKIAPTNTPLLCIEGGSAGRKIGFTNQPVCFVNKLCAFVSNKANPKLIYYFLQTQNFAEQFTKMKHGLIGGVSIKNLTSMKFPLPPLNEQQRIVLLLDELFSKLDEAKELAQAVVDGSELRRAAILHKAFIGELSQLWRDEHGTNLDSWQRVQLGDVCQINPPKISTRNLLDDLEVSFVPMAAVSDVRGEITVPQRKNLREVKSGFTNFAEGDVLFAKITPCMENGKAALVGKLVNHIGYGSTEFFVLRCGEKILNRFVYHLVRWKIFRDEAKSVMAGAVGQQRVPKRFLTSYQLNLPPLNEQKEIVSLLDDLLGRKQRTKELATKTLERVELMKKSILTRAFRGKLSPTEPFKGRTTH
ncbi:MAG: restriction endonuclease subunit S [Selenomonadaceae bacterium]|nr:restriction endonuclease subunit S [Selenomonadaceae bacterium]